MKQEDTKQGNQQKMQKETPHMSGNPAQPDVQQKQEYEQYVKSVTPTHNLWAQMGKAFLTGGIICCIGQGILNYTGNVLGMDPQTAGSWCSLILVFASVVLTALHIYPKIVKWGGAGALVPITGFANSVTAGGIPERRTGIRYRLQDIHHCRTCDPVRNFRQLGIGTDLLGAADVRDPIVS